MQSHGHAASSSGQPLGDPAYGFGCGFPAPSPMVSIPQFDALTPSFFRALLGTELEMNRLQIRQRDETAPLWMQITALLSSLSDLLSLRLCVVLTAEDLSRETDHDFARPLPQDPTKKAKTKTRSGNPKSKGGAPLLMWPLPVRTRVALVKDMEERVEREGVEEAMRRLMGSADGQFFLAGSELADLRSRLSVAVKKTYQKAVRDERKKRKGTTVRDDDPSSVILKKELVRLRKQECKARKERKQIFQELETLGVGTVSRHPPPPPPTTPPPSSPPPPTADIPSPPAAAGAAADSGSEQLQQGGIDRQGEGDGMSSSGCPGGAFVSRESQRVALLKSKLEEARVKLNEASKERRRLIRRIVAADDDFTKKLPGVARIARERDRNERKKGGSAERVMEELVKGEEDGDESESDFSALSDPSDRDGEGELGEDGCCLQAVKSDKHDASPP